MKKLTPDELAVARKHAELFERLEGLPGVHQLLDHIDDLQDDYDTVQAARRGKRKVIDCLGKLLATIHDDKGHYQAEHGSFKATEDAIKQFHNQQVRMEKLSAEIRSLYKAGKEVTKVLEEAYSKLSTETLCCENCLNRFTLEGYYIDGLIYLALSQALPEWRGK